MKKGKTICLDFVIDKLTDSIQNTISKDGFSTEVSHLTRSDLNRQLEKWLGIQLEGEISKQKEKFGLRFNLIAAMYNLNLSTT